MQTPMLLYATFVLAIVSTTYVGGTNDVEECTCATNKQLDYSNLGMIQRQKAISKIGFGSCTIYNRYPQHVWTTGVLPNEPDAWIWLGDFAYFDSPVDACPAVGYENIPGCNCKPTAFTYPPWACKAGNVTSAREKGRRQILDFNYRQFIDYMCPNSDGLQYPPIGDRCERPIIGTYDDHDYGWNNGNRLMANKWEMKNLYLDMIGVDQDDIRRSHIGGIEYKYTFNAQAPLERRIDVFLLDERYERDTLPCEVRREWCEEQLKTGNDNQRNYVWCKDFLETGGEAGTGSCCSADDIWANGWCKNNAEAQGIDPLWDIACDPSSDRFGMTEIEVNETTNTLQLKENFNRTQLTYTSTFCDFLGVQQRQWLQRALLKSKAPLKIIGSGSVLFGNPIAGDRGPCSGDDLECYKPGQANLIHMLNKVEDGCVIVLTGDYHISDFKILEPGEKHNYTDYYPTKELKRPIIQVMSSGMTPLTADDYLLDDPCADWRRDQVGLRPDGPCSHVAHPSFGMMEIDWERRVVHFQLRLSQDGSVATGVNGAGGQLSIDMNTCSRVDHDTSG